MNSTHTKKITAELQSNQTISIRIEPKQVNEFEEEFKTNKKNFEQQTYRQEQCPELRKQCDHLGEKP